MTKILVDGHALDGISQGSVTYLVEIYKRLPQMGFEVFWLSSSEERFKSEFESTSINWIELRGASRMQRYKEMDAAVLKYRPDALHFQYTAPLKKRCFWIDTLHDLLFLDMWRNFPFSYVVTRAASFYLAAKRADLIITGSEFSRNSISRNFGVSQDKIHWINYGAPRFDFPSVRCEKLNGVDYFLYVGRIEPRKNHVRLIHAFSRYLEKSGKDCKLVFVGSESIHAECVHKEAEKLNERVIFLSGLSEGELKWVYENCVAHVYASLGEGFGFPVLESLLLGRPTASSINTSLSAFSSHLDYIFDPSSVADISQSFDFLWKANVDEARINAVSDEFSWDSHVQQFSRLIQRNLDIA